MKWLTRLFVEAIIKYLIIGLLTLMTGLLCNEAWRWHKTGWF